MESDEQNWPSAYLQSMSVAWSSTWPSLHDDILVRSFTSSICRVLSDKNLSPLWTSLALTWLASSHLAADVVNSAVTIGLFSPAAITIMADLLYCLMEKGNIHLRAGWRNEVSDVLKRDFSDPTHIHALFRSQ
jgi:hypothetical protein